MSQNPGMSLAEPWPPSTIDPLADYADPRLAMSLAGPCLSASLPSHSDRGPGKIYRPPVRS